MKCIFEGQGTVTVVVGLGGAMVTFLLSEQTTETKDMASRQDKRMVFSIFVLLS